jgi:hypothetical protein
MKPKIEPHTCLILLFGDEAEVFAVDGELDAGRNAVYWIHRRLEKSNKECTAAYVVSGKIDHLGIIKDYWSELQHAEEQERLAREQQEYKRLKAKFEGKDETKGS